MTELRAISTVPPVTADRRRGLLLRMLPPGLYTGRPHAVWERSIIVYRHTWLTIVSGFFEPLLYLLSFGSGVGALVGTVHGPDGRLLTYGQFIAPALLAASAMNGAVFDSTMNVFFKLKFQRLYDTMLATSLGPLDVAAGEIGWSLLRGGLYAVGFIVVMLAMGLILSPWALLLLPTALLIAFGFAAVGMALTTYMRGVPDLDMVNLAVLPMFLFSGTFFSTSTYPTALRWLVDALPLSHGVALMRAFAIGNMSVGLVGHALYFVVMAALGLRLTTRRLGRLLLS